MLIAVGAILVWGLQSDVVGISEDAIGVILMVVGGAGPILSMIFWSSGAAGGRRHRRTSKKACPQRLRENGGADG